MYIFIIHNTYDKCNNVIIKNNSLYNIYYVPDTRLSSVLTFIYFTFKIILRGRFTIVILI